MTMDVFILLVFKPAWIHSCRPPVCTVTVKLVKIRRQHFEVRQWRLQGMWEFVVQVFVDRLASMLDADVGLCSTNGETDASSNKS